MITIDVDTFYLIPGSGLSMEDQRHLMFLICMEDDLFFITTPSEEHEKHVADALGITDRYAAAVKRRLLKAGVIDLDWRPIIGKEGGK